MRLLARIRKTESGLLKNRFACLLAKGTVVFILRGAAPPHDRLSYGMLHNR
jgi:hypothetical protein